MKTMLSFLACGVLSLVLLSACSKQPAKEISAAKAAVDTAMSEGAEKYAPEEAAKVNDELTAAMNEVNAQNGKFPKDYSHAREDLAKVKLDADSLRAGLSVKKEEARNRALLAQAGARTAVNEAAKLITKSSRTALQKADMPAMRADLKALEDALAEAQKLIDAEDFRAASDKAEKIRGRAADLADRARHSSARILAKDRPGKKTKAGSKKT